MSYDRPSLNPTFSKDEESPDEEHVYLVNIQDQKCKLTCYQESIVDHIRNRHGSPLHLLVLHSEFGHRCLHWDVLLLDWTETIAHRVGALKFSFLFPAGVVGWNNVFQEVGLTNADFALA
jgi:hypothetical protein